jgi:hypothetical protein
MTRRGQAHLRCPQTGDADAENTVAHFYFS